MQEEVRFAPKEVYLVMTGFNQKTKIVPIIAIIIMGIGFSVYFFEGEAQLETYDGPPRAVIIDQLYEDMPNEEFHIKATQYLETAGYVVDLVTTQDVTVDFYKNLPKMNYKYVVVRTHGAENTNNVVLFTGEKYSEEQYIQEQLFGQVTKAAPLLETSFLVNEDNSSSEWVIVNASFRYLTTPVDRVNNIANEYFAISPKLISGAMNGKFNDTVFILGGCNTLSNPSLADALIKKGASAVIGWDNTVGSRDNDFATLQYLDDVFSNEIEMKDAVELISSYYLVPGYMPYPATFTLYSGPNI